MKSKKGFTLIELLVVIAIIAILAVTVFVALDPVKRFKDSRNARRWQDVNNLLTAIHEYTVDTGGSTPFGIGTSEKQLGTCLSGGSTQCPTAINTCLNIGATLATYLKSIPVDPRGSDTATGYSVVADSNNLITVKACNAEDITIQVSR